MEGDPYCSHCGAHLSWDNSNKDKHDPIDGRFNNYVRRPTSGNSDSEKIDEVLNSMHLFDAKKRLGLKRKLLEFYSAKDCINFQKTVRHPWQFQYLLHLCYSGSCMHVNTAHSFVLL